LNLNIAWKRGADFWLLPLGRSLTDASLTFTTARAYRSTSGNFITATSSGSYISIKVKINQRGDLKRELIKESQKTEAESKQQATCVTQDADVAFHFNANQISPQVCFILLSSHLKESTSSCIY
jgi:hypothetical protein